MLSVHRKWLAGFIAPNSLCHLDEQYVVHSGYFVSMASGTVLIQGIRTCGDTTTILLFRLNFKDHSGILPSSSTMNNCPRLLEVEKVGCNNKVLLHSSPCETISVSSREI